MKQLYIFIKKEFRHIFRDTRTLAILFLMPIALVIIFGFAIRTEIRDARIAVLDNAKDEMSIALTQKMLSSGYFIMDNYLESNAQIEETFRSKDINLIVVFPNNFAEDFKKLNQVPIQIIADASNLNVATQLIGYAENIIGAYNQELTKQYGNIAPFDTSIRMMYNPEMKDVYMFVPGVLALILMLVSAMMSSVSLTREKEFGTLKILTISPLSTMMIIIGKVIPYLFLSLINTVIIISMSMTIFGMPVNGSFVDLFVVCLSFLFTALSLGIFISSVAKTQQIAIMISILGLFLPTTLLSGFIYPIENMPIPLQVVCQVFPAKWFIEAIKTVMIKGGGIEYFWQQVTVMSFMGVVFIIISTIKYSKNK